MASEKNANESITPRKRARKTEDPFAAAPTLSEEPTTEEIPDEPVIKPAETFTFKATHFYAVLVVLAFAAGVLIGYAAWGRQTQVVVTQDQGSQAGAAAPTSAAQYVRYKIPTDGFPSKGPANAPITLVEFADFQCPFCRQWEQQTYQPLLDKYAGKIRIVYRDFPLTQIHPNALPAAEAAQCANEQGKFWEFHDKLFEGQDLSPAIYDQYAQELGLSMTQFDQCVSTEKYKAAIEADSQFAEQLGINSTPTFFINGLAIVGAQPISVFEQVIDKELAGQIPK